ncbi:MAG: hypothetical protein HC897_07680 [Thermoanaerobaculia bacterium]|nr:hypothetical protein [Thermoanaerobaculia bacterium]
MSTMRASVWVAMIFTFNGLLVPVANAQNLVPNGSFTTDIEGWELPSVPNTSITWDAFGNPAGSLRIETTWVNPAPGTGISVVSPCLRLSPGRHNLRGDVFSQTATGGCGINLFFYDSLDCSDNPGNTSITFAPDGVWETQEQEFEVFTEEAYRVVLFMSVFAPTGPETCNFDNVSLTGPRNLDVPTLGGWGLIALAGALAGCGIFVSLRRRLGS